MGFVITTVAAAWADEHYFTDKAVDIMGRPGNVALR
jgi:hypothetical protein